MAWRGTVEQWFVAQGFQTEWIWMGRDQAFLLTWKGRALTVYFVEPEGFSGPDGAMAVKQLFLELFSCLRRLETWDRVFKGREVSFKWLSFRGLPAPQVEILEEAGVEPFFFPPEDDFPD